MASVDLDDEFLNLLYDITNTDKPKQIQLGDLKDQLGKIVNTLKSLNRTSKKPYQCKALNNEAVDTDDNPAILVIDDLGVITYQLKVLLSNFEMDIDCSQEIYDAVNKFKKRKYQYVIMDLFIPTEREGFILLTELRKMATAANCRTIIGVITASPRKEIEQQCKARGADFFLEKNNDWQSELHKIMDGYIHASEGDMLF